MKKLTLRIFDRKADSETTSDFIVASTKSQNNLIEDLEKNKKLYVAVLGAKEFYIDRETAKKFAEDLANETDCPKEMLNAILGALEVACIIKRLDK